MGPSYWYNILKFTLAGHTPLMPIFFITLLGTIETFMKHLEAATHKPVPSRAEFAGVLAAGNSKGPLRLYANLGEDK